MNRDRIARSCDTFVVQPSFTDGNFFIFGKNSDRPGNEIQEVIFVPNEPISNETDSIQCTYIKIPKVSKTYRCILSKPSWCWGAEMGANDQGVCIGNEAVFSTVDYEERKPSLTGLDIVRLALERASTAKSAVDIIGNLVETYGQGGSCYDAASNSSFGYDNSFLVVDHNQVWTIETCDRVWVAKQIQSGFYNMSNVYAIGADYDLQSVNLESFAKEKHLWNGNEKLNFRRTFQDSSSHNDDRLKAGQNLLESLTKDKNFSIFDMISILRDEPSNICMTKTPSCITTASQVSILSSKDKKNSVDSCHFFTGTPNPKLSLFKPFIFSERIDFGSLTVSNPAEANGNQAHALYHVHQKATKAKLEDERLKNLEKEGINEIINKMKSSENTNADNYENLFNDAVSAEIELLRELAPKKRS